MVEYEAEIVKRSMDSITVQPLVADEAFMPHMEAMYVPFHMGYCSLICYKGLQSERPKCLRQLVESSWTSLCKSVSKTILFGCEKGTASAFLPVT